MPLNGTTCPRTGHVVYKYTLYSVAEIPVCDWVVCVAVGKEGARGQPTYRQTRQTCPQTNKANLLIYKQESRRYFQYCVRELNLL